ncbi:MAG: hypothetical protein R3181_14630, partial [Rubricoccaceae bacterium]|nr:hypothetical protein [Rubricoccaceae bacterium]
MTTPALRHALLLAAVAGTLFPAAPSAQGLPEGGLHEGGLPAGLPAPGDGFTWERVGDRGLEVDHLTFGLDSTLWAVGGLDPHRLDLSGGFPGVWVLLTDLYPIDRLLALGRGAEGDTLLGVSPGRVLRSTDGGGTWQEVYDRGGGGLYEVPSGYPFAGRLFASAFDADPRTIFYSDDRGATWTEGEVPGQPGSYAYARAFVALPPGSPHPGRLLAAGRWGINVSDDGGDTWVESGLWRVLYYSNDAVDVVNGVGGEPGGGVVTGGCVVGLPDARVWASADGGTTWAAGPGGIDGLFLPEGPPYGEGPHPALSVGARARSWCSTGARSTAPTTPGRRGPRS